MKLHHAVKTLAVVGTSALTVLASAPAHASAAHSAPVRTISSGLEGPFGLDILSSKYALVAESGTAPNTGQVTAVDLRTGHRRALITGLTSPAGVASDGHRIYVVLGGGGGPGEGPPPPPSKYPASSLLVLGHSGCRTATAEVPGLARARRRHRGCRSSTKGGSRAVPLLHPPG